MEYYFKLNSLADFFDLLHKNSLNVDFKASWNDQTGVTITMEKSCLDIRIISASSIDWDFRVSMHFESNFVNQEFCKACSFFAKYEK
jgi:hypothetical protein